MTLTEKIRKNWARAAGATGAALATGYILLGAFDISRFNQEALTWETEPAKTTALIGATLASAGLTYALSPKVAQLFTSTKQKVKQMGKLGCAALIGMTAGIAGLGYINHNVRKIGAWDPVKTAHAIYENASTKDPERNRNINFLKHYVFSEPFKLDSDERLTVVHGWPTIEYEINGHWIENGQEITGIARQFANFKDQPLILLQDRAMRQHPEFKGASLNGTSLDGIFGRYASPNQIQFYEINGKVWRADVEEPVQFNGANFNGNYAPFHRIPKLRIRDAFTNQDLFGGELTDIIVPERHALKKINGEYILQCARQAAQNNLEVYTATQDGTVSKVTDGQTHLDTFNYAFEAQLR